MHACVCVRRDIRECKKLCLGRWINPDLTTVIAGVNDFGFNESSRFNISLVSSDLLNPATTV